MQVITGSSYRFDDPLAVCSDGTHVWVANSAGDSVTELDAATGNLVQVISGFRYGFNDSEAISCDGTHVWVVNTVGGSVTELDAATGNLYGLSEDPATSSRARGRSLRMALTCG